MARLLAKKGINQGLEWHIEDGQTAVVGRDLRNEVCLTDLRVSRRHCEIERRGSACLVRNLSKTNGTFVNKAQVAERRLQNGDEVAIGDTVLQFFADEPAAAAPRDENRIDLSDDTVAWMPAEDDRLAERNINYTINMSESSVSRLAHDETDLRRLRMMTERLAMLQELSNAMIREFDQKRLMKLLLDQIFSVIEADSGYIFTMDAATRKLAPMAGRERGRETDPEDFQVSRSLARRAINERIGILSADTLSDDRFKDQGSIIMSGIRSALCVPMVVGEKVLGLIHLDTKSVARQFTQDDLKLLTMMANQAAISLGNARLRDEIVAEQAQRKSLSRYVSPQLLDRLMKEGFAEATRAREVEVTVLYCDIRGFTSMSEAMRPQEVMDLLNDYCGAMAHIVFARNGSVDKYIGDCVMAVFGSPEPEPQHALRAIECGLDMLKASDGMTAGGKPLKVGVGVHTGFCIQGNIGAEAMTQFTAVGDSVNTASRLCGVAGPGEVVISEATLRAAGGEKGFRAVERGAVELKGKKETLKLFTALPEGAPSPEESGATIPKPLDEEEGDAERPGAATRPGRPAVT